MNKAAALIDSGAEPTLQERDLWKKSFSNFESGIRTFDVIDDRLAKTFSLCLASLVLLYLFGYWSFRYKVVSLFSRSVDSFSYLA